MFPLRLKELVFVESNQNAFEMQMKDEQRNVQFIFHIIHLIVSLFHFLFETTNRKSIFHVIFMGK